jgi:uncharacterized protein YbjT (DUF2867 family)
MIAVTGAAGVVGGEVLRAAAAADIPSRALVRKPPVRLAAPAEAVEVDLDNAAAAGRALSGCQTLFLLAGFADIAGLLAAARAAGVQRVALLSAGAVEDGDETNAVVAMNVASERAVRASGLGWTILRPSGFQSNALRWLPQLAAGDIVRDPFPDVPIALVDPADLGAAAVTVLEGGHDGETLRLTGPEALRPAEQMAIVAAATGRPIRIQAQPQSEAREEMRATMPEPFVDALFRFFADGEYDDGRVDPTLPGLLGRPAGTLAAWAARHADRFRRQP